MEGSQNFNLGHVTVTMPTLGPICLHWLVHVMANVCTKYEVSTFGDCKHIKVVPKFRKWSRDLSHAPSGVKFSHADKGIHTMY